MIFFQFIITGAYQRTNTMKDPVERIRTTMIEVGSSITATTVTTTLAFMLGCLSTVPAIQWLCIYSFVTIIIDFLYQITLFVAFIVIDQRRIQANRRDLFRCCCCCTPRCNRTAANTNPDTTENAENTSTTFLDESLGEDNINNVNDTMNEEQQHLELANQVQQSITKVKKTKKASTRHFSERIMSKYADILLHPFSKAVVLGAFFGFAVVCALQTSKLQQNFDVAEFFPHDSYVIGMLDAMDEYSKRTLAVEIYFRGVNQSNTAVQEQMIQYVDDLAALEQFQDDVPLCWIKDFQTIQERDEFHQEEYEVYRNMTFNQQVKIALSIPGVNEAYGRNIILDETTGDIVASREYFLNMHLSLC